MLFIKLMLTALASSVNQRPKQAHPQFWAKSRARRGERFLRTPRRWLLPGAGGVQPRFLGSPSIPPSFAERHAMPPGKSFPAGIPHPSLSPPGNPGEGKLGVGKKAQKGEMRFKPDWGLEPRSKLLL